MCSFSFSQIAAEVEKTKGIKKAIFNYAFKKKKSAVDKGVVKNNTFWDKLIFQKMQVCLYLLEQLQILSFDMYCTSYCAAVDWHVIVGTALCLAILV